MQKKTKRAVRAAFSVLTASACLAAVCGGLSRKALLEWGGRLAMLSVGIQQPDGGAEALSGRLEREPAAGGSSTTPPTSGTKPSGDDHAADHPADRMGKRHSVADPSHVSRAGHP